MVEILPFNGITALIKYLNCNGGLMDLKEILFWKPEWIIQRWKNQEDFENNVLYEKSKAKDLFGGFPQINKINHNVLCKNGLNNLWKLIATSGGTQWANGNAQIAVGTSSTAANIADTALGANALYKGMDATYPIISGTNNEICTWRATFGASDGNQAWNEFGLFSNTSAGNLLSHVVSSQGTKTAGQVWRAQIAVTL